MAGIFDGEEFGKGIVEAVNASIDRQLAPLIRRLEALEAVDVRAPVSELERRLEADVKRFDEAMERALNKMATREMIDDAVSKAVESEETIQVIEVLADKAVAFYTKEIPTPQNGKDADPEIMRAMIVEECKDIRAGLESTIGPEMQEALAVMVAEAVKAIPVPVAPELPDIAAMVAEAVKAIELPELPEIVIPELPDIAGMIDERVKAIELPELPDIAGMVKELTDAAELRVDSQMKSAFDHWRKNEFRSELDEAVKAIPVPVAPELPDIAAMVDNTVSKAVALIPVPVAPELPDIAGMVKDAVSEITIPIPADGKDVDMDDVHKRVDDVLAAGLESYKAAVADIRIPEDGKSVTLDDVKPLIDEAVSKAVAAVPVPQDGKDGADVMDALINRGGHLVLTFSDGRTKDIGKVVGDDGVDCDIDGVWKILNAKLDALPKPKDGMGFDDLTVEYDGERTFKFVMVRGTDRKEFPFTVPMVIDRGIYSDGKTYARGDAVTWDGSSWIAQSDGAKEKPGTGKEWRLAIKRGKAGKDGVMTVPRPNVPVKLGDR